MPNAVGKPDPNTWRKITGTEAEITSLAIHGLWVIQVGAEGQVSLRRRQGYMGGGVAYWGPDSTQVRALEAHWVAKAPRPKRLPQEPSDREGPHFLRKVVKVEDHPRDRLRRFDVLECGHRVKMLKSVPRRLTRNCQGCAVSSSLLTSR